MAYRRNTEHMALIDKAPENTQPQLCAMIRIPGYLHIVVRPSKAILEAHGIHISQPQVSGKCFDPEMHVKINMG